MKQTPTQKKEMTILVALLEPDFKLSESIIVISCIAQQLGSIEIAYEGSQLCVECHPSPWFICVLATKQRAGAKA